MRRLILLARSFLPSSTLIALLLKLFMPADAVRPWKLLLAVVHNWWPVLFLSLGTALLASLVALQEKKAGNDRNLRIHPASLTILIIHDQIRGAVRASARFRMDWLAAEPAQDSLQRALIGAALISCRFLPRFCQTGRTIFDSVHITNEHKQRQSDKEKLNERIDKKADP